MIYEARWHAARALRAVAALVEPPATAPVTIGERTVFVPHNGYGYSTGTNGTSNDGVILTWHWTG